MVKITWIREGYNCGSPGRNETIREIDERGATVRMASWPMSDFNPTLLGWKSVDEAKAAARRRRGEVQR